MRDSSKYLANFFLLIGFAVWSNPSKILYSAFDNLIYNSKFLELSFLGWIIFGFLTCVGLICVLTGWYILKRKELHQNV